MPRPLLRRCNHDSIQSFRAAASVRLTDGLEAAKVNRRTAPIYLWGYCAEMTLKAAYFAAVGFDETRAITFGDLNTAWRAGTTTFGISWPSQGKFHNVRAWCDLLARYRSTMPGLAYSDPRFEDEVKLRGKKIEPIWSETLRYHHNVAYEYEVASMKEAVQWLMDHSLSL